MVAGGGVFATGDMSGSAMRWAASFFASADAEWTSIPMFTERIDTVSIRGRIDGRSFTTNPAISRNDLPALLREWESWAPHPLLRSPRGDIDVMPTTA